MAIKKCPLRCPFFPSPIPEFVSFFDSLFMPFILGKDMKSLKEIFFTEPKAETAGTLVDGRPLSTVAEDECVGHIVMTRHTEINDVVLPTCVSFWSEEEMWPFYVKATYVYIHKYNSTAQEIVACFSLDTL